MIRQFIT